jgi:translation initiation factor IF-2
LTGINVDKLLDAINALAEINEYKANPNRLATGVILESNFDKGFGVVVTALIKNGSMRLGDYLIAGASFGKVRAMFDEKNTNVNIVYPSTPVKLIGLSETPAAGEHFVVSQNEKDIKELAKKIKLHSNTMSILSDNLTKHSDVDGIKHTFIILKTDVHGSLEAIKNMLLKLNIDGTKLHLIRNAVGGITESDVQLAKASNALIIGFNIKPMRNVKDQADNEKVKILFFDIIYKLSESMIDILKGSLDPIYEEKENGEAIIQKIWKHSLIGTIAGCLVQNGEINRNDKVRVLRNGAVIINTKINSLKHLKDVVNKVSTGMECGVTLEKFNDVQEGDTIQTYSIIRKEIK